ncbi:hypothetical protein D9613_009401 [Agrocybe pediades]|uniref:Uncharacterized protein n=1 Tax=Agrocybe pediades TaxID=84607 RepID=A0A8H4VU08_9AGAR|nr:hypothetical protein D9613_009401 [Agrocybe pediades]
MSNHFQHAVASTCEIIDCDLASFHIAYNDDAKDNGSHFDQALDFVKKSEDTLKDLKAKKIVEPEYKLDVLLIDMVTKASHEAGQRFASIAIILAHRHNRVAALALAWMKCFAVRLLALAFTLEAEEGPTLAYDASVQYQILVTYLPEYPYGSKAEALDWEYPDGQPAREDVLRAEFFIPPPRTHTMNETTQFAYDTLRVWANLTEKGWERRLDTAENALRLASVHVHDFPMMKIYLEEDKVSWLSLEHVDSGILIPVPLQGDPQYVHGILDRLRWTILYRRRVAQSCLPSAGQVVR